MKGLVGYEVTQASVKGFRGGLHVITVTCWFGITKASQIMVSVFLLRVNAGTILGEM